MRAFQISGSSARSTVPASSSCSSSKRRITCRLYVASSASTRIGEGATQLTELYHSSSSTSRSASGNVSRSCGKK